MTVKQTQIDYCMVPLIFFNLLKTELVLRQLNCLTANHSPPQTYLIEVELHSLICTKSNEYLSL